MTSVQAAKYAVVTQTLENKEKMKVNKERNLMASNRIVFEFCISEFNHEFATRGKWKQDSKIIFKQVIIKDYVGAFDWVTAAQCRGLSCEIEAKCTSHNKMAPKH